MSRTDLLARAALSPDIGVASDAIMGINGLSQDELMSVFRVVLQEARNVAWTADAFPDNAEKIAEAVSKMHRGAGEVVQR